MKISRQVGTVSQVLNLFIQDATVSTGAGLANIIGSTLNFSWTKNTQVAFSTGTASTAGTTGTFSTSALTQVHSSQAKGLYHFCPPDGLFASGDAAVIMFYGSTGVAASMAPLAVEIEITRTNNQVYMSSQTISSTQVVAGSGPAASTIAIAVWDEITTSHTNSSTFGQGMRNQSIGVSSVVSGVNTTTQTALVGVSTLTAGVNVTSIQGAGAVTSAAGVFDVNILRIGNTATAGQPGYMGLDWGKIVNPTSSQVLSSTFISTSQAIAGASAPTAAQVAAAVWDEITTSHTATSTFGQGMRNQSISASTVAAGVNVTSIQGSAAVTSSAGLLDVNISKILNTTSAGQAGYVGLDWGVIVNPNSSHVFSSTFISTSQAIAGASAPTAAQVAAAVWDEITTSHTASSTFGRTATVEAANVSTIASGVNVTTLTAAVTLNTVSSSAWPYFGIIDSGAAQSTGANSITLRSALALSTSVLEGATIFIYSATTAGQGARRLVTSWSGTSDIAGVDTWTQIPDSTASYIVFATPPASNSQLPQVNVTQIQGSNAVTTAAGTLGVALSNPVGVSTMSVLVGVSTITTPVGVSTFAGTTNANIIQVMGAAAVTSSAGLLNINVSRILNTTSAGQPGYVGIDWGNLVNPNSANTLSSTFISTSQVIAGASAPTALQVAQAVWDEVTTSHSASSSFGRTVTVMASLTSTQAVSSDSRLALLDASVSSRVASSDARLAFLDVSVSSRVASSDARMARLDISVSSRAAAGDAMTLTTTERAQIASTVLTTTNAESYRSVNAIGSLSQLTYEILANLIDFSNSGTTRTLNSVTSHAGAVATYQYNSTTPSAITRTA